MIKVLQKLLDEGFLRPGKNDMREKREKHSTQTSALLKK